MITISGNDALAKFREGLTGRYGLDLVSQYGGRVLVQLPVGVGKSRWIDTITLEALQGGNYDLVVVLCPTRQLIEEREPLRNRPQGIKVINLRPRPAKQCGRRRDAAWKQFEAADLGALGRIEVCGNCPLKSKCFWPRQYGKGMKGARLVYATQAHLERSPGFLINLGSWTQAKRVLTLLDEVSFLAKSFEGLVTAGTLNRFLDVLRLASLTVADRNWRHRQWLELVELLRDASTLDLQDGDWHMPFVNPQWAAAVQRVGVDRFGSTFKFLGYALNQFSYSPLETRQRDDQGNIRFGIRPYVGDCMVFSGTADQKFAQYRLGRDLANPFADYRFIHPDTRWHNLASPIGSRKYFGRHSQQILDFFAELIARRTVAGKRVLLVAKKCFVEQCAKKLTERFRTKKLDLQFVTDKWSEALLADPGVVPLINYGMIGTNLFEGFDAVYCLTGFYVNENVVNSCLQDLTPKNLRLPIKIETVGTPRRRKARVVNPDDRYYDTAKLVQPALEFQEHHVVIQAVGRVRPFTRPREVITFQMAQLPGVQYDREFRLLEDARRFFGVASGRVSKMKTLADQIQALRRSGKTQAETGSILNVTERTIRNYERKEDRKNYI